MSLPETARWKAFFLLDRLHGGEIGRAYERIRDAYKNGVPEGRTEDELRALIGHAADTTPFYRGYDRDAALNDLPVLTKNDLKEHWEDLQSLPFRDLATNRKMSTSGSTGTPLTVVQDQRKANRAVADGVFCGEMAGYRIGEKQAFLRVWVHNVNKGRFRLFLENMIPLDTSDLSDEAIAGMLALFRKKKVKCLIGYASALSMISSYLDRTGKSTEVLSIHSIIPISESMPPAVRTRLSEQFRCPVRAWYSNEENGIMSVQEDDGRYYVDSAQFRYEILDMDRDVAVPDGTLGRIVITDLSNYAMPLIRYDTGDLARAVHIDGPKGKKLYLTEIFGRRSDLLYNSKDEPVTPFVVTNNLWDVTGIRQYQLIQEGRGRYTMLLNADRSPALEVLIKDRLLPYFGQDAEITFTYVDGIPVLASGKRKYIESRYQPS